MKQIMKNVLLVLSVVLVFSGCSNWKQDPLSDKDNILGTGSGKPVELVEPKPLSSDAIRIISQDFLRFKEGVELSFNILTKNLLPGYGTELVIDNMSDFPGAKFVASTGVFTWKPTKGSILSSEVEKYMVLKVRAIASKPGSAVIFNDKDIQVVLNRQFTKPQITSVARSLPTLREGESIDIKVMIEDMDADPTDVKTWSYLNLAPTQWKKTITGYMSLKSYRHISGITYEAVFTIDLKDAEISESKDTYAFDLVLNSRFNQASDRFSQDIDVYTKFTDLKSTWTTILEAKLGTKVSYQFLIYDPKAELTVSFVGLKNQIRDSTVKCIKATTSTLSCAFDFDTTALTVPAVYSFSVVTRTNNQFTGDTLEISKELNLTINLIK